LTSLQLQGLAVLRRNEELNKSFTLDFFNERAYFFLGGVLEQGSFSS
jgi:hypothetical protein